MLLLESELPGQSWKRLDEKIWRTGVVSPRPEWSQRARNAGSFTGIRSFEQARVKSRELVYEPSVATVFASTKLTT